MKKSEILQTLNLLKAGTLTIDEAAEKIIIPPSRELDFATLDNEREMRVGYPEVIYCEGKTPEQVKQIVQAMLLSGEKNILGTRASKEIFDAVKTVAPDSNYNLLGRVITIIRTPLQIDEKNYIAIVSAGTSDMSVVEEASETATLLGNKVVKVIDVGVAGIHRLFAKIDVLRGAKVIIVIAGMEGALVSVVAGLVASPVIGVPTSIGYGTSFGGVSALLTMLNSCASGVTVVNIDNGFGAAYAASIINKLT